MRCCWAVVFLAACSFDSSGVGNGSPQPGIDAAPPNVDAPISIDGPMVTPDGARATIPHVPPGHDNFGTSDLTLTSSTIDTTALTVTGVVLPAGVTFDASPQNCAQCPELAILHVFALTVPTGSIVRVIGTRPLVIL